MTAKPQDGLVSAKRIMERLANMPPKPHSETKADEPLPGKPKRGRPPSKKRVSEDKN